MSLGKGGQRQSSKGSTGFDPQTQDWINKIFQATQTAAGTAPTGVDPRVTAAGDFFGQQMGNAGLGAAALGGDAAAVARLANPYTEQVIDASRGAFDALQQRTARDVASQATQAGAFGGSRAAVAQGVAQAANTRDQAQLEATLRNQGFTDAMARAGQLVNFGFGGAQGAAGIGQYSRDVANENNLWRMNVLKQGLLNTPTGTTFNTSGAGVNANAGFKIPFFG